MKYFSRIVLFSGLLLGGCRTATAPAPVVTDFTSCVAAGYEVMESAPRRCRAPDATVYQEVVELPSGDDDSAFRDPFTIPMEIDQGITLNNLPSGTVVSGTVQITGQAIGPWFSEAMFPVELLSADGQILATASAQAGGDWMTTDPVPFTVELIVPPDATGNGIIRFRNANPSGEPVLDQIVDIPVQF